MGRKLLPLGLVYALALGLRLWGTERGYLGDEGFSYYLALVNPLMGFFDVHPPLYYGLLKASSLVLGKDPFLYPILHAFLSALAAPLAYLIAPGAGLLVAVWPALVEGGAYMRPHGLAPVLLALWAVAWERGGSIRTWTAHLMLVGHFSTQVVLLLSLPLMPRGERKALLFSLLQNPFLYLEAARYAAVGYGLLTGEGARILPNWPEFLDAILVQGSGALPLALLAGIGFWRKPHLGLWFHGLLLALGLGAGAEGVYAPPLAFLAALGAGVALSLRPWWVLAGALAFLPYGLQAAEGMREARQQALKIAPSGLTMEVHLSEPDTMGGALKDLINACRR